jgi:hypothetical protein
VLHASGGGSDEYRFRRFEILAQRASMIVAPGGRLDLFAPKFGYNQPWVVAMIRIILSMMAVS